MSNFISGVGCGIYRHNFNDTACVRKKSANLPEFITALVVLEVLHDEFLEGRNAKNQRVLALHFEAVVQNTLLQKFAP